jgi:hypothetical protein
MAFPCSGPGVPFICTFIYHRFKTTNHDSNALILKFHMLLYFLPLKRLLNC